jgi:hypothetical protein
MKYYLTYSERTYETDPPDRDGGEWSYRGGSGCDYTLKQLRLTKPMGEHLLLDTEDNFDLLYGAGEYEAGDEVWVVSVKYQDGDTFGHGEYWTVVALCDGPKEAGKVEKKCQASNNKGETHREYRPWDGYFASLLDVHVEPMILGP